MQINLDRPDKIYSEILKTYDSKNILIPEYLYFQDYYNDFFESDFLSRNNLEDFTKVNNDKYQLFDYIVKNQIFIKKKQNNTYELTLPKKDSNQSFFKEYLSYAAIFALKKFDDTMIKLHEYDVKNLDKKLEDLEETYMVADKTNLLTDFYNTEKFKINLEKKEKLDYVLFFKSYKFFYNEKWIVRINESKIENYNTFAKVVLPLVLSFIFYSLFVLIKLKTQDQQN